jgi:hypothetical protein
LRHGEHEGKKKISGCATPYLPLLLTTQLEVLATLEGDVVTALASAALQTKDNFLGGLRLKSGRRKTCHGS